MRNCRNLLRIGINERATFNCFPAKFEDKDMLTVWFHIGQETGLYVLYINTRQRGLL